MSPRPGGFRPAAGPAEAPEHPAPGDLVLCIDDGGRLLVRPDGPRRFPSWRGVAGQLGEPARRLFLGHLAERRAWALEVASPHAGPALAARSLRQCFMHFDAGAVQAAARAVQLLAWDREHRFCGRCATETEVRPFDHDRRCPSCGQSHFPRQAPAVIVLVHRGDRILLGRGPHLPAGMFSTLAGFVEPGESLEEAVHREIAEEVGVEVADPTYFGSQSWPFPHSLMIGFFARWRSGEIRLEPGPDGRVEIEEAEWFDLDDLPTIPSRISIARALIEAFRSRFRQGAPRAAPDGRRHRSGQKA